MTELSSTEFLKSIMESDSRVAVTAPLMEQDRVLIGVARSSDKPFSVVLSINEFKELCPSIYLRLNSPRVFHGLKRIWEFLDVKGLLPYGDTHKDIDIHKIDDTRLIAYLLDPASSREVEYGEYRVQEELTLASVAHHYLGYDYPYRITEIYEEPSLEQVGDILAHDADLILRLSKLLPTLMSSDLYNLYRSLELPLMLVLDDMRRVGIGFEGFKCREVLRETERSMAELAAEITGGQSVDLSSAEEVHTFLVERGVPLPVSPAQIKRKALRQPLEHVAHLYPLVRQLLAWWDLGRDLGFLRRWAGHDRIHPVWGQTRSATSRIYARNPAVQNVARELRKLFVPAPGYVLIKADYSQAQMRILAHLSQDPELMRIFRDPNGDVHSETSEALGLQDRNAAKEINFAICFGMGLAALCRKLNELKESRGVGEFIDEETARSYIDGFYVRFPGVKEFFDQEWETLRRLPPEQRVVRSLVGRERTFPRRPKAEMERQFRVTWTQQIEADLMKTAMVRLDRIFRRRNMKARIVMMIHDALWVECPNEEEPGVRRLVTKMMTTAVRLDVPLELDFE